MSQYPQYWGIFHQSCDYTSCHIYKNHRLKKQVATSAAIVVRRNRRARSFCKKRRCVRITSAHLALFVRSHQLRIRSSQSVGRDLSLEALRYTILWICLYSLSLFLFSEPLHLPVKRHKIAVALHSGRHQSGDCGADIRFRVLLGGDPAYIIPQ